jgi:hypothetical protein
MTEKEAKTYWVKIYLAGPIEVAKQFIRKKAKKQGMCVTIEPTTYIYTGGEETGYVIGYINYPRFPKTSNVIWELAHELAHELKDETGQKSFTMMSPDVTYFFSDE